MMKAAVIQQPGKLEIKDVPVPKIEPHEVLIRVMHAGICRTDIHVYNGGISADYPIIPGHEFSGVIEQVGKEVIGFYEGQPVCPGGSWGCGTCEACLNKKYAFCKERKALGRTVNGSFAEYVKMPAANVIPLPQGVDLEDAQSLVTVACSIHAVERAAPSFGSSAILFGPGSSGLLLLQVLLLAGVDKVGVVGGRRISRLEIAQQLGAEFAVSSSSPEFESFLKNFNKGSGADLVVDATGNPQVFNNTLQFVRPGGVLLVYGIYDKPVENFAVQELYNREVDIRGLKGSGNCYDKAVRILEKKLVKVKPTITHRLPLAQLAEGFNMVHQNKQDAIRIVITFA